MPAPTLPKRSIPSFNPPNAEKNGAGATSTTCIWISSQDFRGAQASTRAALEKSVTFRPSNFDAFAGLIRAPRLIRAHPIECNFPRNFISSGKVDFLVDIRL
jgi:hypothetical protein